MKTFGAVAEVGVTQAGAAITSTVTVAWLLLNVPLVGVTATAQAFFVAQATARVSLPVTVVCSFRFFCCCDTVTRSVSVAGEEQVVVPPTVATPVTWLVVPPGSMLATYGMARGWVEFWLVWILVDVVGVTTLVQAGYYPTAGMYLFYAVFVVIGFVIWRRDSTTVVEAPSEEKEVATV